MRSSLPLLTAPALLLVLTLCGVGCAAQGEDDAAATASARLESATEVRTRLEPVTAATDRILGPLRAGGEAAGAGYGQATFAWREAVAALEADTFPQAGTALLFQCRAVFRDVAGMDVQPGDPEALDFGVEALTGRLRDCRMRAATMAGAAGGVQNAMAFGKVERYAAAALGLVAAHAARDGRPQTALALDREAAGPITSPRTDDGF